MTGGGRHTVSRAAIEYALRDADRRKALLRVVAIARPPEYWAVAYGGPALPLPEEIKASVMRRRTTRRRSRL